MKLDNIKKWKRSFCRNLITLFCKNPLCSKQCLTKAHIVFYFLFQTCQGWLLNTHTSPKVGNNWHLTDSQKEKKYSTVLLPKKCDKKLKIHSEMYTESKKTNQSFQCLMKNFSFYLNLREPWH